MALDVKTQLVIVSAWGGLSGLLLAILSKSALRHLACIWAGMIASISLLEVSRLFVVACFVVGDRPECFRPG